MYNMDHTQIPNDIMADLWINMKRGLFEGIRVSVDRLISLGYPLSGILSQLHDDTVGRADINDVDKSLICEKLAEVKTVTKC